MLIHACGSCGHTWNSLNGQSATICPACGNDGNKREPWQPRQADATMLLSGNKRGLTDHDMRVLRTPLGPTVGEALRGRG